jgi:hypothetical protein
VLTPRRRDGGQGSQIHRSSKIGDGKGRRKRKCTRASLTDFTGLDTYKILRHICETLNIDKININIDKINN